MTQENKNFAEQTTKSGLLGSVDQAGGKKPADAKVPPSDLVSTVSEIKKELAHVTTTLQKEAKTVASNALDLAKHPSRYAELGASLAEGMAGESLGEMVGAGLGSVLGPEGTVIGAEVGAIVCEVFGARQGGKIAKELLHQPETEHPLKEDLQIEGSERVGGHAGKTFGGMIGDALFDDAGGEIGEAVGEKIGNLVGKLTFEKVAKLHIKNNDELFSDDTSQTNIKL